MTYDLRQHLEGLDKRGELLHITPEVDTLDEMGAFIARADYERIDKALLFENPKGFDIPVLANTIGSTYTRIASTFGVPVESAIPSVAQKMGKIMGGGLVPPVYVDNDKAPCKEVILKGDDVDLNILPIMRLNPHDGSGTDNMFEGRFCSGPCISKPNPKGHNISYHRFEQQSKTGGPVWVFRMTGDARSISEAWGATPADPPSSWDRENAKPFPMAYVIGLTPEFLMVGANPALPHGFDDFAFIGGVTGEPVPMVKCETIDVDVPANAEIVVEGIFNPFDFRKQGRYASFNGFYDEPRPRPYFEVTAITMRKNPIYQHIHIGRPLNECNNIAAFFRGVRVFIQVKEVLPNLVDVFVDPAAGVGFTVHLSLKKSRIGEPKMAMMRAYTALGGFCKHVFVYDDDIDIRNPHERDWALAHRFMADRDLLVIPNVMGMIIDPLAQGDLGSRSKLGVYDGHPEILKNVRTFMGVDCTTPLGLAVMDRVYPDPDVEARVDKIFQQMNGHISG